MFPFKDVISILTFVLPGFITWEIYRYWYPAKKATQFNQFAWSFFISIIIYLILSYSNGDLTPGLTSNLSHDSINKTDSLKTEANSTTQHLNTIVNNNISKHFISPNNIVKSFSFAIILAILISLFRWIFALLKQRIRLLEKIFPRRVYSTWAIINDNKKDETQWALVRLSNDEKYFGYINYWEFDPDAENPVYDFLLSDARIVEIEDYKIIQKEKIQGQGVYLNTRDVISIQFHEGNPPSDNNYIQDKKSRLKIFTEYIKSMIGLQKK